MTYFQSVENKKHIQLKNLQTVKSRVAVCSTLEVFDSMLLISIEQWVMEIKLRKQPHQNSKLTKTFRTLVTNQANLQVQISELVTAMKKLTKKPLYPQLPEFKEWGGISSFCRIQSSASITDWFLYTIYFLTKN